MPGKSQYHTDAVLSLDAALGQETDPATVACTVNTDTARTFKVGDFIVLNDEAAEASTAARARVKARL
jgi:hypothetical protein